MNALHLPHGDLPLPAYLPDATHAVVRGVDAHDLSACGIDALVMNTFHLMQRPGVTTIKALGGLHKMSGWHKPIVTDSGGFQAYSMIRENSKYGTLTDKGIVFRPENGGDKIIFTPEKSVQLQLSFGADVVICLDDCTHVDDSDEVQQTSVKRTISWAKRCRDEFVKLTGHKPGTLAANRGGDRPSARPLLFGVIQGGGDKALRAQCAGALLALGFDGYGYGGWPLDKQGNLVSDIVGFTREIVPREFPMHALGIGHPRSVIECTRMGYDLFDCAMPTRDARHGRLYIGEPMGGEWRYVYVEDDKHIKESRPLDEDCDCHTCATYSTGYLHHLYKIKDVSFARLATIHNLRFMARLIAALRGAGSGKDDGRRTTDDG